MLALLLALSLSAEAKPSQMLFGEIAFSNQPGTDVLRMPECSKKRSWNRPVAALSLRLRANTYLHDILVRVEGGPDQLLEVRQTLPARGATYDFALDGNPCVTWIELVHDNSLPIVPLPRRQVFQVYGKFPPPQPPEAPPPAPPPPAPAPPPTE